MIRLQLLGSLGLSLADGAEVRAVLTQPKRLALLAYLAAASPRGFHRRDALLALFWPDSTERQARLSLRQAVHHLRHALGASVIANRGHCEIGLVPGALWCDAVAFRSALLDGEPNSALELYRGDLLEGFSIDGISIELERWLEDERMALRTLAVGAASSLSEQAANEGDLALGVQWARRALALSAGDESALRRLVGMLDRRGDRAGALRTAEEFARRMREELGVEPAPETAQLLACIRARAAARPTTERLLLTSGEPHGGWQSETVEDPVMAPAITRTINASDHQSRIGHSRLRPAAMTAVLVTLGVAVAAGAMRARVARPAPARDAVEQSSASLVSRRFYEEGLRTYYQVDVRRSNQFFRAALSEDSTCAMCAYYAAISESDVDVSMALQHFRIAVRLANRAPDRERLYIQGGWNWFVGEPFRLSTAESLAVRDPDDPAAQFGMARALSDAGRFERAASYYRRVIELDSLGLHGLSLRCLACDAEEALIRTYWAADSFAAAERAARTWIRAQPLSYKAWHHLAETYQRLGRRGEARAVRDTAIRLVPADAADGDERALDAIRSGDFAEADAYFTIRARVGGPSVQRSALWWLIISLRNQGRLREALAAAKRYRWVAGSTVGGASPVAFAVPMAQVMFEQGRFRESAALFDSVANERPRHTVGLPGIRARERCWALTHEVESLAASGDTAAVAALADSIEQLGALSASGGNRLLHHHVRALMLRARHDWPAAESEFRLGIYSVTEGYTRTNLQLARILLAGRRPLEAVAILRPALRGSLEASNYFVTRTEIQEALGQAFDMAGQLDSSAVYDQLVVRAWAQADPLFAARAGVARARLASAERVLVRR